MLGPPRSSVVSERLLMFVVAQQVSSSVGRNPRKVAALTNRLFMVVVHLERLDDNLGPDGHLLADLNVLHAGTRLGAHVPSH